MENDEFVECPYCGSSEVILTDKARRENDYNMYYCTECGNEFSDNMEE